MCAEDTHGSQGDRTEMTIKSHAPPHDRAEAGSPTKKTANDLLGPEFAAPLPWLFLSIYHGAKYSCPEIRKPNPTENPPSSTSACLALLPASACGLKIKR